MSETEMVERVGETLRDECMKVFGSTWSYDHAWRFARAAIEAMREPTHDMRYAVPSRVQNVLSFRDIGDTWRAMIDAALGEGDG